MFYTFDECYISPVPPRLTSTNLVLLVLGVQWTLANPNSLGPEPIQISEIFGLVKATAATCVIVTTP